MPFMLVVRLQPWYLICLHKLYVGEKTDNSRIIFLFTLSYRVWTLLHLLLFTSSIFASYLLFLLNVL